MGKHKVKRVQQWLPREKQEGAHYQNVSFFVRRVMGMENVHHREMVCSPLKPERGTEGLCSSAVPPPTPVPHEGHSFVLRFGGKTEHLSGCCWRG